MSVQPKYQKYQVRASFVDSSDYDGEHTVQAGAGWTNGLSVVPLAKQLVASIPPVTQAMANAGAACTSRTRFHTGYLDLHDL